MGLGLRLIIFLCCLCISTLHAAGNASPTGKRILWINTYSADDPWCRSLMAGFQETMKQAALNGKYEVFDLGIRYQLEGATAAADVVALREMLQTNPYDLIVTTDTSAAELFLNMQLRKPDKVPVLLTAYAGAVPLRKRIPADSGLTGIQIGRNLEDAVRLAKLLRPDLKEATIVTEAVSGGGTTPQIAPNIQERLGIKIQVIGGNEYSTEAMLEKVSQLPKDSLLLFNSWMSAQETLAAHSYTVLPQIREMFPGLILGKQDAYMRFGSMGGVIQQGIDVGRQSGKMAIKLMNGAPGGRLSVEESVPVICLDETALREIGIPSSRAPKETIWVNIPPSFFAKYTVQLGALGVIVIVLLGAYSAMLRTKRQLQLKNEMLFQHLPSRLFVFDRWGTVLYSHIPEHEKEAIRSVKDLPEEISRLFAETIEQVSRDGKDEVRVYCLNEQHRRTQFLRLPVNNPFSQDAVMVISSDVTELRRNEMLYRDNLNLFQTVVEHLPGFLFVKDIDNEFRFLLCNSRFEELMGHTSAELIGHRDRDFFVDENGLNKIEEDDKKLVAEGNTLDITEAFTNSAGRFFAMRMVKKLLCKSDGTRLLLGMGIDLTREYQLEQKQEETIKMLNEHIASERILYQLLSGITMAESFDSAVNAMLKFVGESLDADRCYVFRYAGERYSASNNTHEWCRAKEYSLFDQMQNVDMGAYPEFNKLMLNRQVLALNDTSQPPPQFGDEFETLRALNVKAILGSGIWIDNKLYGFIGMDFDRQAKTFTECDIRTADGIGNVFQLAYDRAKQRELLEDSLDEQKRQKHELEIAMEKVLVADRAKSYFLATVSHELRTPLNAIIGFSELMLHDQLARETQEEYLRSVRFAGSTLLNLVNDVLDLSKLEAEQMNISPAETDICMLIREVSNVFKLKTAEKGLAFQVELPDESYILYVDALRLRQVLLNLLGNAFKFTTSGKVGLRADFVPAPEGNKGKLTLCVSDTGIGISKENQANIFNPFVQDSVTRGKRVYEGSGLGLAITKRLLEKMDAKITLESEPGVGTSFTVEIDNVQYELKPGTETRSLKIAPVPTRKKTIRVLIVDDIPLNLRVLGAMLKRINVESVPLTSADAALKFLENDQDFAAILTDIWMPEISGIELARSIRSNPATAGIPIAAVTADTQVIEKDAENFAFILTKPISIESLERLFQTVISQ